MQVSGLKAAVGLQKVVVRLGEQVIKGYLESPAFDSLEELMGSAGNGPLDRLRIRLADSNEIEEISIRDAKAVFLVNSFEGNAEHVPLNFHSRVPVLSGVWVRLEFVDGEVMEGIVHNSINCLIAQGFFLLPTAPDSNNRLVYVQKSWLSDYKVLGLRKL